MTDYDVIVVGAGHNGLTVAALLQRAGLRTVCLEAKRYAGGMASTVELFDGFRFEIAGSVQVPTSAVVSEALGLDSLPTVDLDVMSVQLRGIGDDPVIYYTDPMRLLTHLNEVHGHAAGDTVLRLVSGVARSMLRGRDIVGRLGGDQFIALLPDTTPQDALHVATRMARLVDDKQRERGSAREVVGLSAGIVQVQEQETMDHAIHRATEAVAEAKRHGARHAVVAGIDAQGALTVSAVQAFKPARY